MLVYFQSSAEPAQMISNKSSSLDIVIRVLVLVRILNLCFKKSQE